MRALTCVRLHTHTHTHTHTRTHARTHARREIVILPQVIKRTQLLFEQRSDWWLFSALPLKWLHKKQNVTSCGRLLSAEEEKKEEQKKNDSDVSCRNWKRLRCTRWKAFVSGAWFWAFILNQVYIHLATCFSSTGAEMSDVFPEIYRYTYTMYICLPRKPDEPNVWDTFTPTCFS